MVSNLTHLVHYSSALDSISVTEIEELIAKAPSADAYKVLLDKKMSRIHTHDSVLAGADKMLLSNIFIDEAHLTHEAPKFLQEKPEINQLDIVQESLESSEIIQLKDNDITPPKEDLDTEMEENEKQIITEDISRRVITHHPVEEVEEVEVIPMSIEVTIDDELSANLNEEQDTFTNKKNGKKNKQKQKSFKLKEYSGISEYAKWLLTFKKVDIEKQIRKEEKTAKKRALEANAKKSVTKSDLIASEPLAEILAIQGHFDDAKKMYEQLMHKYPEKSSYFAAKINNLLKI
jgi:hypothetical protein